MKPGGGATSPKRGTADSAGKSRICLSLTGSSLSEDLRLLEACRPYIDMVELRADFLDPQELGSLERFPRLAAVPAILTIRRQQDGGRWSGEESRRRQLVARGLSGGYAFVDLEEDLEDPELARTAQRSSTRVIRSLHDFSGLPARLTERCRGLAHRAGEIPKLAVMPNSTRDLVRLARACSDLEGVEKILIGMGERGLFSRILATRLGSFLTYCSAGATPAGPRQTGASTPGATPLSAAPPSATPPGASPASAAPGHLDPRRLVELYRFRAQDRNTFVCGVIGKPIAHSRSPELHNRGYDLLGLNGVYLPFLVDEVEHFFALAELLDLRGFSVTMPHKQAVMPLLQEQDPCLEAIGACNTVVRRAGCTYGHPGWYGTNTDVRGFLAPLEKQAGELLEPGTRATVIGAGGGARSVVYALLQRGVRPLVVNRTPRRAEALARYFGCDYAGLDAAGIARIRENADLIVQATSVGMEPDRAGDPAPGYEFRGTETVYDLVYEPLETVFLSRARRAGCRTISGLEMLQAQGAAQFALFTEKEYPREALEGHT